MPVVKLLKLILLFVISTHTSFAVIRYVTPAGAGLQNGGSWANAAPGTSLQAIINASAPGDQVWVSCGTYFTTNTANRAISFAMRNGVSIYGGFAGTESLLSQRALSCGPCSILSGEIGSASVADNSFHVLSNPVGINNTAIIDGFIIQGANDNRAPTISDGLGGGIYNNGGFGGNSCNPTIRNCVIRNNFAQFGAGIFNSGHTGGNASPSISNCIIVNNTAYLGGGGIDNFGLGGTASPTLTNCLVYGNTASQRAGGMYCWGGNNGNASPIIINCVFANNSSVDAGGLIADRENSPGGSFSGNSDPVILNSVFWGNTASGTGPQFFLLGGTSFNATYSNINLAGQNPPHTVTGPATGNLDTNPQFVNLANAIGADNCWFSADDGLKLLNISPMINAGNATGAPVTDITGMARVGNPDMGIYEYDKIPVTLNVFLQGYYNGINSMRPTIFDLGISSNPAETDTITVNLWAPSNLSNTIPDHSVMAVVHTDGTAGMEFPASANGHSFYIAVKHRNHLETWSKLPVTFTSTTAYDFSTALAQAYDDGINPPMASVAGGKFAFYGGDVNQDGTVDASDMAEVDNDNAIFAFGYNKTDVNGDGATDASDISIVDNNQALFLFYARPY